MKVNLNLLFSMELGVYDGMKELLLMNFDSGFQLEGMGSAEFEQGELEDNLSLLLLRDISLICRSRAYILVISDLAL